MKCSNALQNVIAFRKVQWSVSKPRRGMLNFLKNLWIFLVFESSSKPTAYLCLEQISGILGHDVQHILFLVKLYGWTQAKVSYYTLFHCLDVTVCTRLKREQAFTQVCNRTFYTFSLMFLSGGLCHNYASVYPDCGCSCAWPDTGWRYERRYILYHPRFEKAWWIRGMFWERSNYVHPILCLPMFIYGL